MKAYFVSGLAADSRVFINIRLPHGFETVHLDWIKPTAGESLGSYSARLGATISPSESFLLIGLSMGGMIVSELARIRREAKMTEPVLTILLSSVPVPAHLPPHFSVARVLQLHRIIPASFLKSASLMRRLFPGRDNKNAILLREVIRDSDPVFIRWALGAILNWKSEFVPSPLLHIHGNRDLILPSKYTRPTHIIEHGSHLMLLDKAAEVNTLIAKALARIHPTPGNCE